MRSAFRLAAAGTLALGLACPAGAEVRALLVGVSDYERIDADLTGPGNDVRILAEALIARGVAPAAITVLSDRTEGLAPVGRIARPTRAEILGGLDRLAAEAGPGDTMVFYFSGHGSQQPDTDGDEQGGMDEIFLPIDAGRWSGAAGGVENAILDDEFRARADAILATGARLVAVLDACHSATGFRAIGDGASRARYVAPESLGVPAAAGSGDGHLGAAPAGDYVFLYSAQADQRAFEYPLREGAGPDEWYGEFTRNLVAVLAAAPDLTWRQLVQATTDGMRSEGTIAIQRPEAEGPLLDAPVFGSAAAPAAARYRIADDQIAVGLLGGVRDGAVIALHADAAGAGVLGRARLSAPGPDRARLTMEDGSRLPAAAAYGSVLDPGAAPPLRFSLPLRADPADGQEYVAIEAALEALRSAGGLPYGFAAESYDMALVLTGGTLAVAGRDGTLDAAGPGSSLRLALDPARAGPQIAAALEKIARVHLLQTALDRARGGAAGGGALLLSTNALKSQLAVLPGRVAADGNRCAAAGDLSAAVPARDPVALRHCDVAVLSLRNLSSKAQDVTVLYVDAGFGITALWPRGDTSNRIAFNETVRLPLRIATRDAAGRPLPTGTEQLIVLSVPAPPETKERTVLTGLVQPGVSRGADPTGIAAFLGAAMDPDRSSRALGAAGARPALNVIRHQFHLQSDPG